MRRLSAGFGQPGRAAPTLTEKAPFVGTGVLDGPSLTDTPGGVSLLTDKAPFIGTGVLDGPLIVHQYKSSPWASEKLLQGEFFIGGDAWQKSTVC